MDRTGERRRAGSARGAKALMPMPLAYVAFTNPPNFRALRATQPGSFSSARQYGKQRVRKGASAYDLAR
jgi:hypothetical protein